MKKIRCETFETNSSSTHTLVICTKDEYRKWGKGEYLYLPKEEKLVPKEEAEKYFKKEIIWKKADYKTDENGNRFYEYKGIKAKDIESFYTKENIDEITREDMETYNNYFEYPLTKEEYFDNNGNETYEREYTTPNGDEVVVFGDFGYDG